MNFKLFIALFALVGAAVAVPTRFVDIAKKNSKCMNPSENLFNEIGKTYQYDYSSVSEIELENGDKSQVTIKATAEVQTTAACEHQLRLQNVQIEGSTETQQLRERLQRMPIRFYQDGRRIRQIVHHADEDQTSLNFKRAVISALQISSFEDISTVEKDAMGRCETNYKVVEGGRNDQQLQLVKEKKLRTCSQRRHPLSDLLWNVQSNGRSSCDISVDTSRRVITKVTCYEESSVAPLQKTSAATELRAKVTLKHVDTHETRPDQFQPKWEEFVFADLAFQKPSDAYKFVQSPEQQQQLQKQTMELLYQIRQHKATAEAAQQMNQLADYVAKMNAESLQTIVDKLYKSKQQNVSDKRLQRLFTDVVAQSGNEAALTVMFEKALEADQPLRRWYWLAHLSTVRQARPETVQQLIQLLRRQQQDLPRQAVLSIGKIVANSNVRNEQPKIWLDAVDTIAEFIVKTEQKGEERTQIAAVLALKSTGMTEEIAFQLLKFIYNSESIELRLASIDAIGAQEDLVSDKIAEKLYEVYQQQDQQRAEVRIHAFRALMRHPKQAKKIINTLPKETNEQVRFYIGSYLNNVKVHHMQSDLPAEVQKEVTEFDIPSSFFSHGEKKSSRQIQLSKQVDLLQSFLEFDTDMIYNEEQSLTEVRAKFNMDKQYQTGEQLEIIVRQHGMDRFAEMITERLQQVSFKQMLQQVYEFVRSGRSEQLQKAVEQLLREFAKGGKFAEMHVSVQIAHNEQPMIFVASEDLAELMHESKQTMKEMMTDLTSDISFHSFLLRKQHLLPTVSGIPLRTSVQSTLVASAQIGSGHFHPSISYDAQVLTGFYLPTSSAFVAYKVQMQSSPAFTYKLERDQNGVPSKFQLNMERNQLTLFRLQTSIEYRSFSGESKELQLPSRQSRYTLDALRPYFGVSFYVEMTSPKESVVSNFLVFPAPYDLHVYMQKEETEMTGWQFNIRAPARYHPLARLDQRLSMHKKTTEEPFLYHISYSTPGSVRTREHTFEVELANQQNAKVVKLQLQSPYQQFQVEGRVESNEKRHGVKLQLTLNKRQALLEAAIERQEETKYVPTLRIQLPGMRSISYVGEMSSKTKGKKDSILIKLRDEINGETVLEVNAMRAGRVFTNQYQMTMDAHFKPQAQHSYRYTSHFTVNPNEIDFEANYNHNVGRMVPQVYRIASKMYRNQVNSLETPFNADETKPNKYHAHFEYEIPHSHGDLTWNMNEQLRSEKSPMLESELSVFFGKKSTGTKQRVLYLTQTMKTSTKNEKRMISIHFGAQSKPLAIEHEIEAQIQYEPRKYQQASFNFAVGRKAVEKTVRALIDYEYRPQQEKLFRLETRLDTDFGKAVFYKWNHETERKQNRIIATNSYQWSYDQNKINTAEWSVSYKGETGRDLTQYDLEGQLRVPHHGIDYTVQNVVRMSSHFELKSLFREGSNTHSEIRLFLSRTEQSSLYVDNRLMNIKLETNLIDRNLQLSISGKTTGFSHNTRYDQTNEQFELLSKTSIPSGHLLDMRLKLNSTNAIVIIDPIRQKLNVHYDRVSHTLVMFVKHDQLFSKTKHQLQAIVTMPNPNLITVEAKLDRDQTPLGKLRALWDMQKEASIKMTLGDLRAQLETSNQKNEINAIIEHTPSEFKTNVQLKRTQSTVMEGVIKVTTSSQRSTEGKLRLDMQGESRFSYEDARYQVQMNGNTLKKTVKVYMNDKSNEKSLETSAHLQDNSLQVKYELRNQQSLVNSNQWQVEWQVRHQNRRDEYTHNGQWWNTKLPAYISFNVKDQQGLIDYQTKCETTYEGKWPSHFEMQSQTTVNRVYKSAQKVKITPDQAMVELTTDENKYVFGGEYNKQRKQITIERTNLIAQDQRQHRYQLTVEDDQISFHFDQKAEQKESKIVKVEIKRDSQGKELTVKVGSVDVHFELHERHHHQQQKHMLLKAKFPTFRHMYEQSLEVTTAQDYLSGSVDYMLLTDNEEVIKFSNKYNAVYMQRLNWEGEMQVRRQPQMKVVMNLHSNQKSTVMVKVANDELEMNFEIPTREFQMKLKSPRFHHKSEVQANKNEFNVDVYSHSKSVAGLKWKSNNLDAHLYEYATKVAYDRHSSFDNKHTLKVQLNNLKKDWQTQLTFEHQGWKHIEYELFVKQQMKSIAHVTAKFQYPAYIKHQINLWNTETVFEAKRNEFVRLTYSQDQREMLGFELKDHHQQDHVYAFEMRLFSHHKLQSELKYGRQIKEVSINYDYLPSQLRVTSHVNINRDHIITYNMEVSSDQQRVYQFNGNVSYKQNEFEMQLKTTDKYEMQLSLKSDSMLHAVVLYRNQPQFELKAKKHPYYDVYTRLNIQPLQMTLKVNQDSNEYHMFFETASKQSQFVHTTEVITSQQKYFVATKTESKHFAYNFEYNRKVYEREHLMKVQYRMLKHKGEVVFEYAHKKIIQISADYQKTGSSHSNAQAKGSMDLTKYPYEGQTTVVYGDQKYIIDLKTTQQRETGRYHTDFAARDGFGKKIFNGYSLVSNDFFEMKTNVLGKQYETKFELYNSQENVYGHEMYFIADKVQYGYVAKYQFKDNNQEQQGLIQIKLPEQVVEFTTNLQYTDRGVYEYTAQLYPNKMNSEKYQIAFRTNVPTYEIDLIEAHAKLQFGHSSMKKPITIDVDYHYDAQQQKPIVIRFTVDANESRTPVVGSIELVNSIPKKSVTFKLYESEQKHLQLTGSWNLRMPHHQQSVVWQYNNGFQRPIEGGYVFTANFEQHRYILDLKSINVFIVNVRESAASKYTVDVQLAHGQTKQIVLDMYLNHHYSHLNVFDREGRKYSYTGSVDYSQTNGLRVQLHDSDTKNQVVYLYIKRDGQSFVKVEAKTERQVRQLLQPSAEFVNALTEYGRTQEQIENTFESLVNDMIGDSFVELEQLISRDVYQILTKVMPMETITRIIGQVPYYPVDFVRAVRKLVHHFQDVLEEYIRNHFHPHILETLFDMYDLEYLMKQLNRLWFSFQKSIPVEQIKRSVQFAIDQVTFTQQMFEDHIKQFLGLAIEHLNGLEIIKRPLVHMLEAIPKMGNYVLSLNLSEMVANALEVVTGNPVWLKGNELSYTPEEGLIRMRFFLPKHILHYFE